MQPEGIKGRIALGNYDEAHARRVAIAQWFAAKGSPATPEEVRACFGGSADSIAVDLRAITATDLLTMTRRTDDGRLFCWSVSVGREDAIAALEALWWGLPPRFWGKVSVGSIPAYAPHLGPCWMWTGAMAGPGPEKYGYLRVDGKTIKAATLAYEAMVGPVPTGLILDHLCRVRGCVRPTHLEAVTYRENAIRSPLVYKTHCPQGHPYDAENTALTTTGKRYCKQCNRDSARAAYRRKRAAAA